MISLSCSCLLVLGLAVMPPISRAENSAILVERDVRYGEANHGKETPQPLLLDVYRREGARSAQPAILLIHGGGFGAGDKRQPLYETMARVFAQAGFVAFSINYRLNPEKKLTVSARENAYADARAALLHVKADHRRYGVDPDRILVAGDSAGGAIAVNVTYGQPAGFVRGCINLWGGMAPINPTRAHVPPWDQPITAYPLGPFTPPTCIIHGTGDRVVPLRTSEQLADELAKAGVQHELHTLTGAPHYPETRATEFIPLMLSFALKVAGPTQPTGSGMTTPSTP